MQTAAKPQNQVSTKIKKLFNPWKYIIHSYVVKLTCCSYSCVWCIWYLSNVKLWLYYIISIYRLIFWLDCFHGWWAVSIKLMLEVLYKGHFFSLFLEFPSCNMFLTSTMQYMYFHYPTYLQDLFGCIKDVIFFYKSS